MEGWGAGFFESIRKRLRELVDICVFFCVFLDLFGKNTQSIYLFYKK